MFYATTYQSPVAAITLACDGDGQNLVGLWAEGKKYHGDTVPGAMVEKADIPLFHIAKKWLHRYFARE